MNPFICSRHDPVRHYKNANSFRVHNTLSHPEGRDGPELVACPEAGCGKMLLANSMPIHMQTHKKDNFMTCDMCGYQTQRKCNVSEIWTSESITMKSSLYYFSFGVTLRTSTAKNSATGNAMFARKFCCRWPSSKSTAEKSTRMRLSVAYIAKRAPRGWMITGKNNLKI